MTKCKFAAAFVALIWGVGGQAAAVPPTFNLEYPHVPGQLIVAYKPGVAASAQEQLLKAMGGKVLVKFRANDARLLGFSPAPGMKEMAESDLRLKAKALAADPHVKYVEANTFLHAYDVVPNDPKFNELYGLRNTGANGGTVGADIHATKAWEVTTGSKRVLVGVIDTGIDYNHQDIAPNYWTNPGESGQDANGKDKQTNGIDDDANGYVDDWRGWNFADNNNNPMDDNEHGTHVSGTIGARGNDGVGVAGVNWNVALVALKFLNSSGSGTLDNAVKAIEYSTKLGVTLTSNSWGGGGFSATMHAAIDEARRKGILFVAAAGNDGVDNDNSPHYPSSYTLDNIIAVAATDNKDALASFSCYGGQSVHLAAPGVDILSSVPSGKYAALSGTSMATPHVSGAAALVKAAYPDATYQQIKTRLINTVDQVPELSRRTLAGGRLNVATALINDNIPPGQVHGLQIADQGISSVTVRWGAAGDDGDAGVARRYDVRYAPTPITDEAAWAAATPANARVSLDRDAAVTATISGLALNTQGYLAVKAIDKVGNVGPLSPTQAFSVVKVQKVYENNATTMDGLVAEGTWGLEQDPSRGKQVFSASPSGQYKPNENSALYFPVMNLNSPQLSLSFASWTALEVGFDEGHVEMSTDGGKTWTEIDNVSGSSGSWKAKTYDLSPRLGGATKVQLRFRLTSDSSVEMEGWRLDSVSLYAPAPRP